MIDLKAEYERLNKCLRIDTSRLDDALIEMPELIRDAGEGTAQAIGERDRAEHDYDLAKAHASDRLRTTPAHNEEKGRDEMRSEVRIKSELDMQPEVIKALRNYETAKFHASLWLTLTEALRTKSESLGRICGLINSGYMTPNAVYANRRSELRDKRAALAKRD